MAEITNAADEIRMRLHTLGRDASRIEDAVKDSENALAESRAALQRNYELQDSYTAVLRQLGETTGAMLWPRVRFEPGKP